MRGTLDQSLCSLGCDTMISPTWTMFLPLRLEWAWRMKKGEGRDHDWQPQTIWNMRGDAPKKSVTDYEEKWAKLWDIQKQWQNSIIINKNKNKTLKNHWRVVCTWKTRFLCLFCFVFLKNTLAILRLEWKKKVSFFWKDFRFCTKWNTPHPSRNYLKMLDEP